MDRPPLNNQLDSATFREFYYLKEELTNFCKEYGLPTSGGKLELTERIVIFLDSGKVMAAKSSTKKADLKACITLDMKIEPNFVCSEKHRAFFKAQIGKSFSFNVIFQKWLKEHTGETYEAAVNAYHQIKEDMKKNKTTIDKQFEYNTYIRDFFDDNQGKTLAEAICCWKYKKQFKGHNRYERSDLVVLK